MPLRILAELTPRRNSKAAIVAKPFPVGATGPTQPTAGLPLESPKMLRMSVRIFNWSTSPGSNLG